MFGVDPAVIIMAVMFLLTLCITNFFLLSLYHRCPPNTAMIIAGGGASHGDHNFRIYVGGGTIVWPQFQTLNYLSLEVYPVEIESNTPLISKDGIPLSVRGVAQVKVPGDDVSIAKAAENLLGKTADEIRYIAKQSISGHLRALAGTMTVQELIQGLASFALKVQEASLPDLTKIGLSISSFTITELKPERAGLAANSSNS